MEANKQICWFCENATKPWKCPWADRFKEIPGWEAEPTVIKNRVRGKPVTTSSFKITYCPLFSPGNEGEPERYPLKFNISDLQGEILAQAVRDWNSIEQGKLKYAASSDGYVYREELLKFFWSEWFETLVEHCTEYTPQQIRDFIHVPKRAGK